MSMPAGRRPTTSRPGWPAVIGIVVLLTSGAVIALAGVADLPEPVVAVALIVALAGAVTVVGVAWAGARRRGLGLARSLGRGLRAARRFVVELF